MRKLSIPETNGKENSVHLRSHLLRFAVDSVGAAVSHNRVPWWSESAQHKAEEEREWQVHCFFKGLSEFLPHIGY